MTWILQLYARWGQWKLASEFRIEESPVDAWAALAALADPPRGSPPGEPARPAEAGGAAEIDVLTPAAHLDLLLAVCNAWFRLAANIKQLEEQGQESRQLRNMRRALSAMVESFQAKEVECIDLAGQTFDPRREDIEIIGEPEERPGLDRMVIDRCERPAVIWAGRLVQRARGIVAKPLANAS